MIYDHTKEECSMTVAAGGLTEQGEADCIRRCKFGGATIVFHMNSRELAKEENEMGVF